MKRLKHKPLSKKVIANILASNPPAQDNTLSAPVPSAPVTLSRQSEFDSLNPEQKIKEFLAFARDVVSRYEDNQRLQETSETETQDLLHYMELSEDMNAADGFRAYKDLRTVRRVRRDCKNEIDLLQPVYDFLKSSDLINKLQQIQGQCRVKKEAISCRKYTLRTDVIK